GPLRGCGAGQRPQAVLALEPIGAQAARAMAPGDPPLHSVGVDDDARYPLTIPGVDPGGPQIGRLVGVSVGGHDEILPGIADPRAARPAGVAGSLRAPDVGLVDGQLTRAHRVTLHCTSVNGGVASSWASNTASTGASIWTACIGSPRRFPTIRTLPACGSSTSATTYGACPRRAGCTGWCARSHE